MIILIIFMLFFQWIGTQTGITNSEDFVHLKDEALLNGVVSLDSLETNCFEAETPIINNNTNNHTNNSISSGNPIIIVRDLISAGLNNYLDLGKDR